MNQVGRLLSLIYYCIFRIWLFEEFLSEHECDNLMRVHKLHVEQQSKDAPILCFDSIATLRKHLENVGKKRVKVTPLDFTQGMTATSNRLRSFFKNNIVSKKLCL